MVELQIEDTEVQVLRFGWVVSDRTTADLYSYAARELYDAESSQQSAIGSQQKAESSEQKRILSERHIKRVLMHK